MAHDRVDVRWARHTSAEPQIAKSNDRPACALAVAIPTSYPKPLLGLDNIVCKPLGIRSTTDVEHGGM